MKIALITGKSGNTLTKALIHKGHEVYVITGDKETGGVKYAKDSFVHYFSIDEDNSQTYEDICTWVLKYKVQGLILGTGVWFALDLAKILNEKYNIPTSHEVNFLSIFKNKLETKVLFDKYNLPTLPYHFVKDYSKVDFPIPFVVKSNIDLFPVWLCHSMEEFYEFRKELPEYILNKGILLEEYLDGNDATIPVSVTKKETIAPCVVYWSKQQNYRLKGFGELNPDKLDLEQTQSVLQKCKKMIQNTEYLGLCRFDLRIADNKYCLLEINSVVSIRNEGSSYQAMRREGIDYVDFALNTYLTNIETTI